MVFRKSLLGAPSRRWWVPLAAVCLFAIPSGASIVNGTFDTGLTGWTSEGDVLAASDASLGDDGALYSLLYQGVALAPGSYRFEFDFLNALSGDLIDDLSFPDTFFASLYFTNDLGTFDLANAVFDDVQSVMDLDASGPYNVAGTIGGSVLGPQWTHVTYDFTNAYAYVVPVFELLDLNGIGADSNVRVDNVSITAQSAIVPEPATFTLLALGLAGTVVRTRKRSRV